MKAVGSESLFLEGEAEKGSLTVIGNTNMRPLVQFLMINLDSDA